MAENFTDEELLLASVDDPASFQELYVRWSDQVVAYFYRRTGNLGVATELMAETFAVALERRRRYRYRRGGSAAGWLFGIARNELSHYYRSQSVETRALKRLGLRVPELSDDELERIESLTDAQAATADLRQALSELSAGERAAVELRVIDELEYDDLAQQLGTTEGAARVRVHRGLRRLAVRIGAS